MTAATQNTAITETFHVIDGKAGYQVGEPYKCVKSARARVDKLNAEYGCSDRYFVRVYCWWNKL